VGGGRIYAKVFRFWSAESGRSVLFAWAGAGAAAYARASLIPGARCSASQCTPQSQTRRARDIMPIYTSLRYNTCMYIAALQRLYTSLRIDWPGGSTSHAASPVLPRCSSAGGAQALREVDSLAVHARPAGRARGRAGIAAHGASARLKVQLREGDVPGAATLAVRLLHGRRGGCGNRTARFLDQARSSGGTR
jgi:hypothetical protein